MAGANERRSRFSVAGRSVGGAKTAGPVIYPDTGTTTPQSHRTSWYGSPLYCTGFTGESMT